MQETVTVVTVVMVAVTVVTYRYCKQPLPDVLPYYQPLVKKTRCPSK